MAICVRTLLYGLGLPVQYWLAALQHAVYLHNKLVHTVMKRTPIEGFYGFKLDVGHLKLFGSRVCVKWSGNQSAKLDGKNYTGIFLGYTVTDNNILYLDVTSGIVKQSHYAQFEEAWYLQPDQPPLAQLLYDLGVEPDDITYLATGPITASLPTDYHLPGMIEAVKIPWLPPLPSHNDKPASWHPSKECALLPLPLRISAARDPTSHPIAAAAV